MSVKKWVMSDEWWIMSDEWWKLSDEKCLPKQALNFRAILRNINFGTIFRNINNTYIALIFKTKDSGLITQYCPVSLCNVLYKIMFKMLVKRLKLILPNLISDSQSAFVLRRLITDNILVAYETLHSMKKKKDGAR